jgi:hypothetical protein
MKSDSKSIVILVSSITSIVIILLCLWDLLTSDPYDVVTINPIDVDWSAISLKNININAIIQSLLSALIGFLLTIVVIEYILKKSRDKDLDYKRKLQLNNISKVIKVPLWRYYKAALSISHPLGQLPGNNELKTPIDIKVLAEVFLPQPFTDEPLFESKIAFYSDTVNELKQLFTNILINVDLSESEKLSDILTDYVIYINAHNPCPRILELKDKTIGNQPMTKYIQNELPKLDINNIKPNNIFYPFLELQKQIEYHIEFLDKLYQIAPDFKLH